MFSKITLRISESNGKSKNSLRLCCNTLLPYTALYLSHGTLNRHIRQKETAEMALYFVSTHLFLKVIFGFLELKFESKYEGL